MPFLVHSAVADLPYKINQSEVKPFVKEMFSGVFSDIDRLLTVFDNTEIQTRQLCVPIDWFKRSPGFKEKNELYIENAVKFGTEVLQRCLQETGLSPKDLHHLFFVSTTGISTPSIDARILNQLEECSHIKRSPLWGLGCCGGAAGLSRAFDYVLAYPKEIVALISVELCGLTFQSNDVSKSNLIATSLFADGAACVLIAGDEAKIKGPMQYKNAASILWKNTLDIMGWDFSSSGFHVIFSKDIPTFVRTQVSAAVKQFLQSTGVQTLDHYILHPGGKKVLDAYQQALQISEDKLLPARKILENYGNMSSCTVLYVLDEFLKNGNVKKGETCLITALGPGFSSELIVVEGI